MRTLKEAQAILVEWRLSTVGKTRQLQIDVQMMNMRHDYKTSSDSIRSFVHRDFGYL